LIAGTGDRGTQQGYNICNSTTLGENSWCQTAIINSAEDFCLWGAPVPNTTVGAVEEEMVAYWYVYVALARAGAQVATPELRLFFFPPSVLQRNTALELSPQAL